VESSCELGNEPSGSIKCWELPSGCTTCGLSSCSQPHTVSLLFGGNIYLCGLVVAVPGYRSRGLGFDYRRYQRCCEVLGLERGPFTLVRIIEELLERNVAPPVSKTEINGRGDSLH
jgi:hypothetical protein